MSVDYRLLTRFQESHDRHEAARRALPERWRSDPRAEVQHANELWSARWHGLASTTTGSPPTPPVGRPHEPNLDTSTVGVTGDRNRNSIRTDVSLGLPIQRDVDIGSLLDVLVAQDDASDR
jgi:hypothetical protein